MLGLARTLAHLKVSVWCEQENITLKAISILYSRGEGKDPERTCFHQCFIYIYIDKKINASGDAIQIGKSIQILENKYFKLCFETTQIPKLINVLACSSVEALLLKLLIQSNMNAKLAVEWIHRIVLKSGHMNYHES